MDLYMNGGIKMEDKIDYRKYFKSLENYSYKGPIVGSEFVWNTADNTLSFKPLLSPKVTINAKKIIFNPPATIILWTDGDKTVVKCSKNEIFDPEKGIAMCTLKKLLTQKGYNSMRKEASNWIKKRQVGDEKGNNKPRVVNNGRCVKCGKELDNDRLFLCEDCSKLLDKEE